MKALSDCFWEVKIVKMANSIQISENEQWSYFWRCVPEDNSGLYLEDGFSSSQYWDSETEAKENFEQFVKINNIKYYSYIT